MAFAIRTTKFILVINAYNFLASWQLYPEKGNYENAERPKSGIYKIEAGIEKNQLYISQNYITIENIGSNASYNLIADGEKYLIANIPFADAIQGVFPDGIHFDIVFLKEGQIVLQVLHEILPNGLLKINTIGTNADGKPYNNTEIYHKQMSVLPYSSSVSGAVITPTKEGVIKHKALTAMEEQTNMALMQIRKQIELLALQAQEIQKRKELSMIIYQAKLTFKPDIGQTYYLYEKKDGQHLISMISPKEWGSSLPYKSFIAAVKLLADHTWVEL